MMHRKHFLAVVLSTAVAVIFAAGSATELSAQSKKKSTSSSSKRKSSSSKSKSTSKSKSSSKAKPAAGRLPSFFGQIDLKPEQREEIYEIQGDYKDKIEKLQKELDAIKAKQTKEIEGVLTSTQKRKLSSLRNAAAKSSKSKSKKK